MGTISDRIKSNPHFAAYLRCKLHRRHSEGTIARGLIDRLSDSELVIAYLAHERQRFEYVQKRQASNGNAKISNWRLAVG